jgi:hypothetical protein
MEELHILLIVVSFSLMSLIYFAGMKKIFDEIVKLPNVLKTIFWFTIIAISFYSYLSIYVSYVTKLLKL